MDYFKRFHSNTLAGSGSQYFFRNDDACRIARCRCLYKIFEGGEYPYSFLFSNTVDSTYSDGSVSRQNLEVDAWTIEEMLVGVTTLDDSDPFICPTVTDMKQVLFGGKTRRRVEKGELFSTDPLDLCVAQGQYICLEIAFSGGMIPCHEESIIPSFVYENGEWIASNRHPFPSMIGAAMQPKKRVAFLGDSITQGIGTPYNSYAHWNAVLAEGLGRQYSYWNLGLGFGRADDAASNGAWLYKAKQNDVVFVCYGANDILQGYDAATIKRNLQIIVDRLTEKGISVIIQTVPPFDYGEQHRAVWDDVNDFIKIGLKNAAMVFDCVPYLAVSDAEPHRAKYGGHPNSEGCRIWADALLRAVRLRELI